MYPNAVLTHAREIRMGFILPISLWNLMEIRVVKRQQLNCKVQEQANLKSHVESHGELFTHNSEGNIKEGVVYNRIR